MSAAAPSAPAAVPIEVPERRPAAENGTVTFPLPADAAAAILVGQTVLFRHSRSGALYGLAEAPRSVASPENVAADGEELTELEALRRAVAAADAEIASGVEPLTVESFWAGMEAEFPELRKRSSEGPKT